MSYRRPRPTPPQGVPQNQVTALEAAEVGVHLGNVLMDHLADRYPSLVLTLVEGVQNAIDANAHHVLVFVDQKQHTMFMLDNGDGLNHERFTKAIRTIGRTIKDAKKLGRYGIGVISPINKCERFYILSKAASNFVAWPFVGSEIRAAETTLSIQPQELSEAPALPTLLQQQVIAYLPRSRWSTMLIMEKIIRDRAVTLVDLDEMEEKILNSLGHRMNQQKVTCRIVVIREDGEVEERDIKPGTYTGKPLATFVARGNECGSVNIELYQSRGGKRRHKGQVGVSEADTIYPVSWADVQRQLRASALYREFPDDFGPMIAALDSGFFEGLITAEKITLLPERNKFRYDDAFSDLMFIIASWFDKVGKLIYNEDAAEERGNRERQLAREVLEAVGDRLKGGDPAWRAFLQSATSMMKTGRVGRGHTGEPDTIGREDTPSSRTNRGGGGGQPGKKGAPKKDTAQRGPVDDLPLNVMGDRSARKKTLVKDDSTGFAIEVIDFEYGTQLFHFDRNSGVLEFNSGNEVWSRVYGAHEKRRTQKNDRMTKRLMMWITLEVLTHLSMPPEHFDSLCDQLNRSASFFVDELIMN